MHLRSGKSLPVFSNIPKRPRSRMVRPPNNPNPNNNNNNNNNGAETNPVPNSTGQPNQPVSGNPGANPTGGSTNPALNFTTSESIPSNNPNGGGTNPMINSGTVGASASGSTMSATTSSMAGGFVPPNTNGAMMTQMNVSSMPTNVSHMHGYTDGSQVGGTPSRPPWLPRNPQFGMPTTTMASLYNWPSIESSPSSSAMGNRGNSLNLTNNSMNVLRQQMDESNHDMVNALTQQIGTIFNPVLQTANDNYLLLANQMGRMADFFGAPDAPNNQRVPRANPETQPEVQAQPVRVEREQPEPEVILVNRNQNADDVLRHVRQENVAGQNNLANLVENILAQNGLNIGLHRPNFVSALSEYVLQAELPRGWKIPKFTKFAGDTNESTVEHIARYLAEAGNLANNEDLKMKFFPNSLTKNAFTWFTTLPPHSIHTWTQLERLFHEQFYMGQSRISLKELASMKRKTSEAIDDYLNRFRLLKARCFTQVPEHELVEMAAGGLDYSIRKKLDTQHLRDMAQLADRVRQVERLRAEKARNSKFHKKEKVAYIETYESENEFDDDQEYMENNEVNIAELKPGPPYTCKMLRPSNGKNPVEPKNDRFISKTYTFDITKCDEIFDLLVADGQIIVPKGLKIPPLEQRNKRGFCKYHNFLGHKTSQCVLFRDLVQKALQEGRLKFGEKPKSKQQVDENPLQIADAAYTEPFECLMIEALNLTEGGQLVFIPEEEYENKVEEVYPQAGETLLDFLQRCKENDGEATLCPHCSAVFDKKAAAGLNKFLPHSQNRNNWPSQKPTYSNVLNSQQAPVHQRLGPQKSFVPSNRTPVNQWVHGKNMGYGQRNMEKGNSSNNNPKKDPESRKYDYRNNYKGKNPMTRSQWRRYQRQKRVAAQKSQITADSNGKKPMKERLGEPKAGSSTTNNVEDEHMEADDFLDSEPDLDIIVNVVSILPREFDVCSEITDEEEESGMQMALHRPVCYYVTSNGALEDQMATFERPDEGMKSHLKPLFIQAKVNNVGINKVLIDGGAAVNLMPEFLLRKIGKYLVDLHPHNIVLSNYEGETGFSLGAIQLDVVVGSTIRPTLFLVVASKANYNLLLGREWIHGVGAVPSTLHQRLIIWREDGVVENVEADQSYFKTEVHHLTKHSFDKKLATIAPCTEKDFAYRLAGNGHHAIKLDPTHGFLWEREDGNSEDGEYEGHNYPTGWDVKEDYYV
ncbi:hypothetical protein P8452_02908 [Trifolium repens]|nr:hypothetical protein P8452_02908 [Trifolium repens]